MKLRSSGPHSKFLKIPQVLGRLSVIFFPKQRLRQLGYCAPPPPPPLDSQSLTGITDAYDHSTAQPSATLDSIPGINFYQGRVKATFRIEAARAPRANFMDLLDLQITIHVAFFI